MPPIQRLRKMLTFAYKIESIDKDPFLKQKPAYIKNERAFLRAAEFQI